MTPLGKVVDKCKKMHPDLEALTTGVTLRFGGLQSALIFSLSGPMWKQHYDPKGASPALATRIAPKGPFEAVYLVLVSKVPLSFFYKQLISLALLDLSCGTQDLLCRVQALLVAACGSSSLTRD